MRHSHIPALLLALLLPSCGPGDDAGAGSARPKGEENQGGLVYSNEMGTQQLAARDSVGKAPLPRHLISTVEDICPVHHEKMKLREIPIVFDESAAPETETNPGATAAFPFGLEKIASAGHPLLPSQPLVARVYQCAACIAGKKAAGVNPAAGQATSD